MSSEFFTAKQSDFISDLKHNRLRRINILEGSVRSGKTWISLVAWALWVATRPADGSYLMVAKTITSLRRNCLDLLQSLVGSANFSYSLSAKEARLFGRKVYLEGANDARSESKIRGMTLHGAYCDELTLFAEDFFTMLLSRLSTPGAKLIATTNPDNPGHWLATEYLDRRDQLSMYVDKFLLDDNTFLDAEYINNLKMEYTGVFYERFILGRWVAASGVIYRPFADNAEAFVLDSAPRVAFATIGVDFGGSGSAHAFQCTGFLPDMRGVVTLDEYYSKEPMDATQLSEAFVLFVRKQLAAYRVVEIRADSAEQVLMRSLRNALAAARIGLPIKNARKGEIVDRIRLYCMLMGAGRYKVLRHCKHTIEAFSRAVWDEKKHADVRLDDGTSNIDTLDAQEYSTEPYQKQLIDMMMLGGGT